MQVFRPAARRAVPRHSLPRSALRLNRQNARRYASTEMSPASSGGASGAIAGGIAGGAAAVLIGYTWYRLSGTKTVVDYAHSSKQSIDNAFRSATQNAPKPNEAVTWLKETVTSYTRMIPGANQYVEQAFSDIEKIQQKHGDQVNKIISDAYNELKDVTKNGASLAAATQAWDVLQKAMKRLGDLAGDAAGDIIDEHPELKDKIGGQYKQFKKMAEQYGPEAKQQAEDTMKQVQDIFKGGFSAQNIDKVKQLVEDKTKELRKYGDQAWDQGIKKAQPVLDKYPEVKDQLEKNKDKLLQGDLGQLWTKVQDASKSGNVDDLKKFMQDQISKASDQAGNSLGGLESFLSSIMGSSGKEVSQRFQQLQELSNKHGQEAENLVKSAFDDIKKILEQKVEEGQKLKDKVAKEDGLGASSSSSAYVSGDGAAAARRYLGIDRANSSEHGNSTRNSGGKAT